LGFLVKLNGRKLLEVEMRESSLGATNSGQIELTTVDVEPQQSGVLNVRSALSD
jgi:hypothetical protein